MIGAPLHPRWVKMSEVPLQTRRKEIFQLLGDCLGHTLEIGHKTNSKEVISQGRVKVLLGRVLKLPTQIPLLFDDLQISMLVEVGTDTSSKVSARSASRICGAEKSKVVCSTPPQGLEVKDDDGNPRAYDVSPGVLKFDKMSSKISSW